MEVTGVLVLVKQCHHRRKGDVAMKKIAVILALAIAAGMTLTTAFAFSLLPLLLT
jgi:hypothetical protein